jgi:hypothetical protein
VVSGFSSLMASIAAFIAMALPQRWLLKLPLVFKFVVFAWVGVEHRSVFPSCQVGTPVFTVIRIQTRALGHFAAKPLAPGHK